MMSQLFTLQDFEIHRIINELAAIGATSVPLLSEDFRLALLQEAASYPYTPQAEVVGNGNQTVRQQLSSFADFPASTLYNQLKNAFQNLLDEHLTAVKTYPFATKLNFNTMVLQKYELGSIGITPHRDRSRYINLVCIFNIGGQGKFYLCDDRLGSNAKTIDSSPGNVIFLKAPGFMNSLERPFHYVNDIQTTKFTFGLRQTATASELSV
jgi:hypothetical protein